MNRKPKILPPTIDPKIATQRAAREARDAASPPKLRRSRGAPKPRTQRVTGSVELVLGTDPEHYEDDARNIQAAMDQEGSTPAALARRIGGKDRTPEHNKAWNQFSAPWCAPARQACRSR